MSKGRVLNFIEPYSRLFLKKKQCSFFQRSVIYRYVVDAAYELELEEVYVFYILCVAKGELRGKVTWKWLLLHMFPFVPYAAPVI